MEFHVRTAEAVVKDLEAATGLIGLLRDVAPSTGAGFDVGYMVPIQRLADWVLDLPACPEHHADPGGLLRYAVQAGYFALRLAEGTVFGGSLPSEQRRIVDRESRRAVFLTALASPVWLAHRHLTVVSGQGEPWSEFSSPAALGPWAAAKGGRYVIGWRHQPVEYVRTVGAWVAGDLLAPLWGDMSLEVIRDAMAAVAPEERPQGQETPLQKIVRQALGKSADVAKKTAAVRYVAPVSPVAPTSEQIRSAVVPETVDTPQRSKDAPEPSDQDVPPVVRPQERPPAVAADPLAGLSRPLRELLETLAEDIRDQDAVRKRVSWDESGRWLDVDMNLLGKYGSTPAGVAAALKKVKLAEDGNGRTLRLVESVGVLLLPRGQ